MKYWVLLVAIALIVGCDKKIKEAKSPHDLKFVAAHGSLPQESSPK